jgi:hypothetical protein
MIAQEEAVIEAVQAWLSAMLAGSHEVGDEPDNP